MVQLIEDFESALSSEWTNTSNISRDTTFAYNGSYSLKSIDGATPLGRFEPTELSGGVDINYFECYWLETQSSFGGAITLLDNNDNLIAGVASNNPQWNVYDSANNTWEYVDGGGNYEVWMRAKMIFDYQNSEITYELEDMGDGTLTTDTFSMDSSTDNIATIEINEWNEGSFGSSSTEMYYDNLKIDGLATKSANVLMESIDSVSPNSVNATGQVDSQNNITSGDLGFDVYEAGGSTIISTNTVETNVDLTSQTIPRNFTGTVSGLNDTTNYEIEAFLVDSNGTKYKSGRLAFTTSEPFINGDFKSNTERFTMASQDGVIKYDFSMDFKISKDVSSNSNLVNIKNKILTQFKDGTDKKLKSGVVLDNGTVINSKDISTTTTNSSIEAEFSLVESESSDTDTLTSYEIEDNNGNTFYASEISETEGGRLIILFVNFVSE
jgi:hypothetical protein